MSIRDLKGTVEDRIPIRNVLLSVFYKDGMDNLVLDLFNQTRGYITFISTGGTYKKLKEILGTMADTCLIEVAEHTGYPEMEGGLVKTLHPKIHAGLLGERNNPDHQEYLAKTLDGGVYIDLLVGNLYPFEDMVGKIKKGEIDKKTGKPFNFESARGNIDIGGPAMTRAGAKNFPSCAVLCDPADYEAFLDRVEENDGCTTFDQRLLLAAKVFRMTANYDTEIADYMENPDLGKGVNSVRDCYVFNEGGD